MRRRVAAGTWGVLGAVALAAAVCALPACVTRRMVIRSDPPGAPVWVDEQYVGHTPVKVPFTYYGTRRVQVGPVIGESQAAAEVAKDDTAQEAGKPAPAGKGAEAAVAHQTDATAEKKGRVTYRAQWRNVELDPPFWDWFPIDFVTNVLWPFDLTYEKVVDMNLPPVTAAERDASVVVSRAQAVRARAEQFRTRARSVVPEDLPALQKSDAPQPPAK